MSQSNLPPSQCIKMLWALERRMHVCTHVNQPPCQVPMPREGLRRAIDPKCRVPTGDRHRWDGSNAAQIPERALIHLQTGSRQPASSGSILRTLQTTSPHELWLPRGWRGVCGSHSVRSCHSERSLRSATAQLPPKTWSSMRMCNHALNCISPLFNGRVCMTLAVGHHDFDNSTLMALLPSGILPCPPHHRACSTVSHNCLLEASALTSISHTVFVLASNDASINMLSCQLSSGIPCVRRCQLHGCQTQMGVWPHLTVSTASKCVLYPWNTWP